MKMMPLMTHPHVVPSPFIFRTQFKIL